MTALEKIRETFVETGKFHNVVATNLGDLKLSRSVKTLLDQDPKIAAVYSLAEAKDGTLYAGTGPSARAVVASPSCLPLRENLASGDAT